MPEFAIVYESVGPDPTHRHTICFSKSRVVARQFFEFFQASSHVAYARLIELNKGTDRATRKAATRKKKGEAR